MNYVRFSKCVESNYSLLMKENRVIMNLGYSNTEFMVSNGQKNVRINSGHFFKTLVDRIRVAKKLSSPSEALLSHLIFTSQIKL